MTVSVIIATFNRAVLLETCLEYLERQPFGPHDEVIVVDNGSTDNTARVIADAAMQGDALSVSAYHRAGEYLGIGVASFLHSFDPSIVIFGGGVSQVGSLLFDSFEASLKKRVFHPRYLEDLKIEKAALADDAGLLGALAYAQICLEDR